MRYLTVAADYTQSGLRDDFEGPVEPGALDLPNTLCDELRVWNEQYRKVIPLGEEARHQGATAELIARLDEQGEKLAESVAATFKSEAKVRYYSEGLLRYLKP